MNNLPLPYVRVWAKMFTLSYADRALNDYSKYQNTVGFFYSQIDKQEEIFNNF